VYDPLRVWRSQVQNDVCCSCFNIRAHALARFCHIVVVYQRLNRMLNGGGISPNCITVPFKHFILMEESINGTPGKIPDVCILGDDTQRQLLTATPDNEGWIGLLDGFWFATCILELIIIPIKIGDSFCP